MLQQIFEVCIIPLLGVITAYIVKLVNKKAEEVDNTKIKEYTDLVASLISDCVTSTNQVYVDSLKGKNAFTKEAQENAFKQTYNKVISILSNDAEIVLRQIYGDLEAYLTTMIEAEVKRCKHENQVQ